MKITFLLTQSLESPSGLGRYWPIAHELHRLGHETTVLALHHNLSELEQHRFTREGVDIWYVGQMHVRKAGNLKYYFKPMQLLWIVALATWGLLLGALSVPTDTYFVCKPHPMNGIAALVAHWLRGKPIYLDCDDYEAVSNRFSGKWQRRIITFFEDRLPQFARGITVNTRFTAKRLVSLGYPEKQIFYVPNGIDSNRFASIDPKMIGALRRSLNLVDKHVVLYLGSMSLASHAVDLLLEAFVEISSNDPQAMLLLVGGGEDYVRLQSQAQALNLDEKVVRFVGRVAPDQAPLYYHLAMLSVDPIYDDAVAAARFPLKAVESFACGTPVVTGEVGDRVDLLAHGGGLLVIPGDKDSLAKAILTLISNNQLHAKLQAEALELGKRYDWGRLVKKFVSVYGV